ncbi:zinc finger HIT domain-containing protein 1 [Rhynchocyon petersi]
MAESFIVSKGTPRREAKRHVPSLRHRKGRYRHRSRRLTAHAQQALPAPELRKWWKRKLRVRSQDPGQRRVLDRAARQRRINRQLEALENDNFQDDPHAGLPQLGKRLPQFDDEADTGKKKKKTRGDHFKLRFRKNFQALLEEQNLSVAEGPNYLTACAGPPSRPQRPFCAVCGFPSPYTCVSCGARYCTVRCLGTHQETRCLKWTV